MNQLSFIFLGVICFSKAFACKCNFDGVNAIGKDPVSAETALIVQKEVSKKKSFLRVLQSWSKYQNSVALDEESSCSPQLKEGQRYLLLSFEKISAVEKNKVGFIICNSIFLELDKAKEFVEKLAQKKNPDEFAVNPSWLYCEKSSQCGLEPSVCGGSSFGVNKKYQKVYREWVRKNSPIVDCAQSEIPKRPQSGFCDQNLCSVLVR